MNAFEFSGWLVGLSSIAFGTFVVLKSPNKVLGRAWFLFTLTVAVWGFGSIWIGAARSSDDARLAWQLSYALGVIWIAPTFLRFVSVFLELPASNAFRVHTLMASAFVLLVPARLFFSDVPLRYDGSLYYAAAGHGYPFFFAWWMGLVVYTHWLMIQQYGAVSNVKRSQIRYFMLATCIGYSGGLVNYAANFGAPVYPIGNFTICLYPYIMSVAIIRHSLLDITIIIRKTLVYSAITAILTAVYVAVLTIIARGLEGWAVWSNAYSAAAAACVIALLFNPLRTRLQRWVDRRFPRESFDQELLREATSGFVHEIKRPLANISLPAQLALAELRQSVAQERPLSELAPVLEKRLQFIVDQSQDAGAMIEALRDVLCSPTGNLDDVDVNAALQTVLEEELPRLSAAAVDLRLSLAPGLPPVAGSARQLAIVFHNLIKNACDSFKSKDELPRRLEVQTSFQHGTLRVIVRDAGCGVSAKDLPRLFDPYFTTKGSHGMGIGLYLVRSIVERHRGSVTVESLEGHGTTFTLQFPPRSTVA